MSIDLQHHKKITILALWDEKAADLEKADKLGDKTELDYDNGRFRFALNSPTKFTNGRFRSYDVYLPEKSMAELGKSSAEFLTHAYCKDLKAYTDSLQQNLTEYKKQLLETDKNKKCAQQDSVCYKTFAGIDEALALAKARGDECDQILKAPEAKPQADASQQASVTQQAKPADPATQQASEQKLAELLDGFGTVTGVPYADTDTLAFTDVAQVAMKSEEITNEETKAKAKVRYLEVKIEPNELFQDMESNLPEGTLRVGLTSTGLVNALVFLPRQDGFTRAGVLNGSTFTQQSAFNLLDKSVRLDFMEADGKSNHTNKPPHYFHDLLITVFSAIKNNPASGKGQAAIASHVADRLVDIKNGNFMGQKPYESTPAMREALGLPGAVQGGIQAGKSEKTAPEGISSNTTRVLTLGAVAVAAVLIVRKAVQKLTQPKQLAKERSLLEREPLTQQTQHLHDYIEHPQGIYTSGKVNQAASKVSEEATEAVTKRVRKEAMAEKALDEKDIRRMTPDEIAAKQKLNQIYLDQIEQDLATIGASGRLARLAAGASRKTSRLEAAKRTIADNQAALQEAAERKKPVPPPPPPKETEPPVDPEIAAAKKQTEINAELAKQKQLEAAAAAAEESRIRSLLAAQKLQSELAAGQGSGNGHQPIVPPFPSQSKGTPQIIAPDKKSTEVASNPFGQPPVKPQPMTLEDVDKVLTDIRPDSIAPDKWAELSKYEKIPKEQRDDAWKEAVMQVIRSL